MKSTAPIINALEESSANGLLLRCIASLCRRVRRIELHALVSNLNNSGKITVCSPATQVEIGGLDHNDFWSVFGVLDKVIPVIKSTASELVPFLRKVMERAGSDGASGRPNIWLGKWCEANKDGAQEIIRKARDGDCQYCAVCKWALQGLGDIDLALELTKNSLNEIRIAGIESLELIQGLPEEIAMKSIDRCVDVVSTEMNLDFRIAAIHAVFGLWSRNETLYNYRQDELLDGVLESPAPKESQALAVCVFYYHKLINPTTLTKILNALCGELENPEAVIRCIDGALDSGDPKWDSGAVFRVFASSLKKLDKQAKDIDVHGFTQYVIGNPRHQSKLFSSWLTKGDPELCSFLGRMVSRLAAGALPVNIDREDLPASAEDQIFMSRKCIGFLFTHEIMVASILLAVVKNGKKEARAEAERLLVDPMLLSYGGKLREFLEGMKGCGSRRVDGCIARLLKYHDVYLERLEEASRLEEMKPSLDRRRASALKRREMNRQIQKEAYEKSPLLQLFPQSVLLYGKKSFSIVTQQDGKRVPSVNPLSMYSYSAELPRLLAVDPVGLDQRLAIYRLEKRS